MTATHITPSWGSTSLQPFDSTAAAAARTGHIPLTQPTPGKNGVVARVFCHVRVAVSSGLAPLPRYIPLSHTHATHPSHHAPAPALATSEPGTQSRRVESES